MTYQEKEIMLKDGSPCILRSAKVTDAEDLIRYLKITAAQTPYLVREPEEVDLTMEEEESYLRMKESADRELLLVAIAEGRHIGNCSLMSQGSYKRYAHRCCIAIALYQEYCKRGIGRAMLETVLETARGCGYEQAELEVAAENKPALHLYESLGFQICGTFPRNMKYQDGTYSDTYFMVKNL